MMRILVFNSPIPLVFFASGINSNSYTVGFQFISYHFKPMASVFSTVEIPIAVVSLL